MTGPHLLIRGIHMTCTACGTRAALHPPHGASRLVDVLAHLRAFRDVHLPCERARDSHPRTARSEAQP